jgi:hypothetical protein
MCRCGGPRGVPECDLSGAVPQMEAHSVHRGAEAHPQLRVGEPIDPPAPGVPKASEDPNSKPGHGLQAPSEKAASVCSTWSYRPPLGAVAG